MNCVCVPIILMLLLAMYAPFGLHRTHNLDRHFNTIHTPCLAQHWGSLLKTAQDTINGAMGRRAERTY